MTNGEFGCVLALSGACISNILNMPITIIKDSSLNERPDNESHRACLENQGGKAALTDCSCGWILDIRKGFVSSDRERMKK